MFTKNKIYKMLGGLLLIAGLIFASIQFIPVDRTNPPVIREPNWASMTTRAYAERACFDCHSNETKWPWYSYVAPMSWSVADHVHEGRAEFNVSEWPSGEGDEAAETVREGEMPLWEYTLMHPEAKLSQAELKEFATGLEQTFGSEQGDEVRSHKNQPYYESDEEENEEDD